MKISIYTNSVGKYFFIINNKGMPLCSDKEVAKHLGISLDEYRNRLGKISNGSLYINNNDLYIDISKKEKDHYINLFKEEFVKELTLIEFLKSE